jgi:hypothetical protein
MRRFAGKHWMMLFKLRYLKEQVQDWFRQPSHPRKLDYAVVTRLVPAAELHSRCANPKAVDQPLMDVGTANVA